MNEALDEVELANTGNPTRADELLEQELLETLTENEELRLRVTFLEKRRIVNPPPPHVRVGGLSSAPSPAVNVNRHGSIAIDLNHRVGAGSFIKGTPSYNHNLYDSPRGDAETHRPDMYSTSRNSTSRIGSVGANLMPRELYSPGDEGLNIQ